MIEETAETETVQYTQYTDLQNPELEALHDQNILTGFDSKEWKRNFDTISTQGVM